MKWSLLPWLVLFILLLEIPPADTKAACQLSCPHGFQKDCTCKKCPSGQFWSQMNGRGMCKKCQTPCTQMKNLMEITACTDNTDRSCKCKPGYYCESPVSGTCRRDCEPCINGFTDTSNLNTSCWPYRDCERLRMVVISEGTPTADRVCGYKATHKLETQTSDKLFTTKKTDMKDTTNKTDMLDTKNKTDMLDTTNKTDMLDTTNKTDMLDTTNKTDMLDTKNKTDMLDTKNKTDMLDTTNKTDMPDTTKKMDTPYITNKTDTPDTTKKRDAPDMPYAKKEPRVLDTTSKMYTSDTSYNITQRPLSSTHTTHIIQSSDSPTVTSVASETTAVSGQSADIEGSDQSSEPPTKTTWIILCVFLLGLCLLLYLFRKCKRRSIKYKLECAGRVFARYPGFPNSNTETLLPTSNVTNTGREVREVQGQGCSPGKIQQVNMEHVGKADGINNNIGSIVIYSPGMVILGSNSSEKKEEAETSSEDASEVTRLMSVPQQESSSEEDIRLATQEELGKELSIPVPATSK
ncbi:hypothetical protein KOW79_017291 [Hemibagrus wyckioides]|uniref:TNFR-Cys domain-containing protein n=1 Tax=Hemibagrus wyckioides TaxID=337641 RepID=A0A9D3SCB5_9TELE|nr:hypothetical protein KOW79_017291 [Hemibagrus wyckioides]